MHQPEAECEQDHDGDRHRRDATRRRGATVEEIELAVVLAYNTCGWPQTVMAWRWAREQIERGQ